MGKAIAVVLCQRILHDYGMSFSAASVANEFLRLANRDRKRITPLKMQKLVYFAHGWYLAVTGEPLLTEPIQAWKYGPVIPTLYREFKECGSSPIEFPATRQIPGTGSVIAKLEQEGDAADIDLARKVIERVWDQYGHYSAAQLTSLTHNEGSPWDLVPNKDELGVEISNMSIRDYFVRTAQTT